MRARIAHLILIVVGLVIIAFPLTIGRAPDLTCRGQQMQPGDTCTKADGSELQTYEDREQTANNAKPVIIVVGVLVLAFGSYLLTVDLRKGQRTAQ